MSMDPGMVNWLILGVMILGCLAVIYLISRYEEKRGKRLLSKKQELMLEAAEENAAFVVGQVYQMEDGSLARYASDGKFYKIRMKE